MYFYFELVGRAWLAQSVERWTFNPTVAGSSPASGLTLLLLALLPMTHLTFCSRRRIHSFDESDGQEWLTERKNDEICHLE